jgi:predicted phage tail protein
VTDNDGLSSSDTVTITVVNPPPTAPANVKATAASATQVNLTWTASTSPIGISFYQIQRRHNNGSYSLIGTSTTNSFPNSLLGPGNTYLYRVRAVDTQNAYSPYSNLDLATTILFTDDPISSGVTKVRAVHFSEMRQAVNAVRATAGLPAATWTNASLAGIFITTAHIQEMRNNLSSALASLGFSTLSYTDPTLTTGVTRIRKVHLEELRERVK